MDWGARSIDDVKNLEGWAPPTAGRSITHSSAATVESGSIDVVVVLGVRGWNGKATMLLVGRLERVVFTPCDINGDLVKEPSGTREEGGESSDDREGRGCDDVGVGSDVKSRFRSC